MAHARRAGSFLKVQFRHVVHSPQLSASSRALFKRRFYSPSPRPHAGRSVTTIGARPSWCQIARSRRGRPDRRTGGHPTGPEFTVSRPPGIHYRRVANLLRAEISCVMPMAAGSPIWHSGCARGPAAAGSDSTIAPGSASAGVEPRASRPTSAPPKGRRDAVLVVASRTSARCRPGRDWRTGWRARARLLFEGKRAAEHERSRGRRARRPVGSATQPAPRRRGRRGSPARRCGCRDPPASAGRRGSPGSETPSSGQGLGFLVQKARKSAAWACGRIARLPCSQPAHGRWSGCGKEPARTGRRQVGGAVDAALYSVRPSRRARR